jgi:hypothetical protein
MIEWNLVDEKLPEHGEYVLVKYEKVGLGQPKYGVCQFFETLSVVEGLLKNQWICYNAIHNDSGFKFWARIEEQT